MRIFRLVVFFAALILLIMQPVKAQLLDDLFNTAKTIVQAADSTLRPATNMTDDEEKELGERIAEQINSDLTLLHGKRERRIQSIGSRLEAVLQRGSLRPYSFQLVEEDSTTNAFASAGGWVWIYTGLLDLELDEDELAAVIAHEMTHVDQKHCVHRIQHAAAAERIAGIEAGVLTQIGYSVVTYPFSRDQEIEADTVGMRLMHEAGYDPEGMLRFMDKMIDIEKEQGIYDEPTDEIDAILRRMDSYLTSHPYFRERHAAAEEALERLK